MSPLDSYILIPISIIRNSIINGKAGKTILHWIPPYFSLMPETYTNFIMGINLSGLIAIDSSKIPIYRYFINAYLGLTLLLAYSKWL